MRPLPGQFPPSITASLVGGGLWHLGAATPDRFDLLVFYRGRHSSTCGDHLSLLAASIEDFERRGVSVTVLSTDDLDAAQSAVVDWGLGALRVGWGVPIEIAERFGLHISSALDDAEPNRFAEPGIFLIRPDGLIQTAIVWSGPFGWPSWQELLDGIDYFAATEEPPRGTVAPPTP